MSRKKIILLGGNAGHGKDTLGIFLKNALESRGYSVKLDAFAFTLKSFAQQAMGTPWGLLNGDKTVKESHTFEVAGADTGVTIRKGLQEIGEFFRQTFDTKVWANSLRLRALDATEEVVIVTDCRHPIEEIHWMRETLQQSADVIAVRIRNDRIPVRRGHPSEDHIADEPDETFDHLVENDSSLDHLSDLAGQLLDTIGLRGSRW